jgi:HD-GYP domain-containing protein (c-di-GMP phosphodiesterase class II)
MAQGSIERLIVHLSSAIHTRALYDADHPQVTRTLGRVIESLATACKERRQEEVTFLIVDQDLILDQHALRRGGPYQRSFVQALKQRGIERLTLARGLDGAECEQFLGAMNGSWAPASTAHLIVGRVAAAIDAPVATEPGRLTKRPDRVEPLSAGLLDRAKHAFGQQRGGGRGGLAQFEGIVWSLMDAVSQTAGQMLALAPLREHDEYLFVHSVNVSMLVLAQARAFGIQGDALHAMGLAGMLHDIGKLGIPRELLRKPGALDEAEWKMMKLHPELGLWHLAQIQDTVPLALVVSFEHHLRFDGQPNYPLLSRPRQPCLASQLTSLADTYDAICSHRTYQKGKGHAAALEILKQRAGSFHDPVLVGHFTRLVSSRRHGTT